MGDNVVWLDEARKRCGGRVPDPFLNRAYSDGYGGVKAVNSAPLTTLDDWRKRREGQERRRDDDA